MPRDKQRIRKTYSFYRQVPVNDVKNIDASWRLGLGGGGETVDSEFLQGLMRNGVKTSKETGDIVVSVGSITNQHLYIATLASYGVPTFELDGIEFQNFQILSTTLLSVEGYPANFYYIWKSEHLLTTTSLVIDIG